MMKSVDLNKTYGKQQTKKSRRGEPIMSVCQHQSCKDGPVDLISQLPDEMLHLILSRLPTEDAVKTSVLSTRWTTLWRQSLSLDLSGDFYVGEKIACDDSCGCPFDPDKLCPEPSWKLIEEESSKFISRVNRALQLHQAPALEEFRIRVDYRYMVLPDEVTAEWIRYAFSKRVQRLELDFLKFCEYRGGRLSFDDWSSVVGSGDVPFPKTYLDRCIDFNCLKEVSLKGFNVSNEVIEYLLLKCCCLERLTSVGADRLDDVAVSSPSLKYLNITDAYHIKSIKICSCPNLETLVINSYHEVMLTSAPKLFELHLYGGCMHYQPSDVGRSYRLSQLEVLMVHMLCLKNILELGRHLPELRKLKKLTINTGAYGDDDNLIGLIPLLNACPNLHKFVLQMFWDSLPSRTKIKVERTRHAVKLEHLKVVEVSGYYGRRCEDELIMYLLENAVAVEKLIVDPRSNTSMIGSPPSHDIEEKKAAIRASQLQALVSNHIQVTIL